MIPILPALLLVCHPAAASWGSASSVPFAMGWIHFVRAGDVDGDGLPDVVVAGSNDGGWVSEDRGVALGFALQQADGSFVVSEGDLPLESGMRPFLDLADLDGDGAQDAIIGHTHGFDVWRGGAGGLVAGRAGRTCARAPWRRATWTATATWTWSPSPPGWRR